MANGDDMNIDKGNSPVKEVHLKLKKYYKVESSREIGRGERQYLIDVLKRQESDVSG